MDNLFMIREKVRELYASHSKIFDKAIQFVVAFLTFYMINSNVGFMKMAASPLVTLALSVICTFLPMTLTVIAASALMLSGLKALPLRLHLFVELQFGAGLRKLYAKFHCVLINISNKNAVHTLILIFFLNRNQKQFQSVIFTD